MFTISSSRLVSLAATLLLIVPAKADFHIFNCADANSLAGTSYAAKGVPSNQYDCGGISYGPVFTGTNGADDESYEYSPKFSAVNLCGANLDFYPASDDQTITFFISGGDGTPQGECWKGSGNEMTCSGAACVDDWVCYSYICD